MGYRVGHAVSAGVFLGVIFSLLMVSTVRAQEVEGPPPAFEFGGQIAGFGDTFLAGDGDSNVEFGGKAELDLAINSEGLGLWRGFSVEIGLEGNLGDDLRDAGAGTLLPVNTAMAFPRSGGEDTDLSIVLKQEFGDSGSISVGKINMVKAAGGTPIMGGGGTETFQNLAFAAPISGVTPPYIVGAIATAKAGPAQLVFMVYDPRNAQDEDVLRDPFSEGTTFSASTVIPTAGGTIHSIRLVTSSASGLDLAALPQLTLPERSALVLSKRRGYVYASYSLQQYLAMDDQGNGWGLFGQVSVSDGNPNPVGSSVLAGLGGQATFWGRPKDNWGAGAFRYNLSRDLKDGLQAFGISLRDEYGAEVFYEFALTDHVRIGGDLQAIRPGRADADTAVLGSLRGRLIF